MTAVYYGLGAVACMALGILVAHRRWTGVATLCGVAAMALFATSLWTLRRATIEEAFGKPLTKARVKPGVVYDIVGGVDGRVPTSALKTYLIVRERDGDPNDLRFFLYPGRPVSRAFTVEPDVHGIPTMRPAADKR